MYIHISLITSLRLIQMAFSNMFHYVRINNMLVVVLWDFGIDVITHFVQCIINFIADSYRTGNIITVIFVVQPFSL